MTGLFHVTVTLCPGRSTSAVSHRASRLFPELLKTPLTLSESNPMASPQASYSHIYLPLPFDLECQDASPDRCTVTYTYLHRLSHSRHKPCATFIPPANPQPGPPAQPSLRLGPGWLLGWRHFLPHRPHWMSSTQSERLPLLLWLQPFRLTLAPTSPQFSSTVSTVHRTLPLRHAAALTGNALGTQADSDGKAAPLRSPGMPTARQPPGPPASPSTGPLHLSFPSSAIPRPCFQSSFQCVDTMPAGARQLCNSRWLQ